MNIRPRWALAWAAVLLTTAVMAQPAPPGAASGDDGPAADVAGLIRELGDASFERRTEATRRLTSIGMEAAEALREAAAGGEFETASRARHILTQIERQWFAGVEVSLAFSIEQTEWDRPVNLVVTLHNRTKYPARVPFDLSLPISPAAASDDAVQVGSFLDVADFLRVTGPNGRELEARVDDITADPAVFDTVEERISGGPTSTLAAGQRASYTVRALNRGWARFPMLDRGSHEVVFEYSPEWQDERLNTEGVGRVRSAPVQLTISRGAPATVARGGTEAAIRIERTETELVASLTNTLDVPAHVNQNFGPGAPFAQGRWIVLRGDEYRELFVGRTTGSSWAGFEAEGLRPIAAGETVVLARIELADLAAQLADAGFDPAAGPCLVHFHYTNLCDRKWQQTQSDVIAAEKDAPEALRKPLPRRMLTGTHSSERVELPLPR